MSAGENGKQHGAQQTRLLRHRRAEDAPLITDAKKSPLQGWRHRRKVYFTLQAARIPVLLLSGLIIWLTHNTTLGVLVALLSVPLPWIAVLLANETGDVDKKERQVYKPALVRENRRKLEEEEMSLDSPSRPEIAQADDLSQGNTIEHRRPHDDQP